MGRKYSLVTMLALILAAAALTWFVMTLFIGFPYGTVSERSDAVRDFAALLMRIEEMYIGDYDEEFIADEAMRAAVDALGDRWSFYMTAEEYRSYLDSSHNRYEGLGFNVLSDEETGDLLIVGVFRGSAAEAAGLAAGDTILAVDGTSVKGATIVGLRELLARPIGDSVLLTVRRADGTVEDLTAVYSIVFIDPVAYEMLDGNIGFIELANFNEGAAQRFIEAADDLIEMGALALLIDLRGNNGGYVSEVTGILDYLLPAGEIFVTVYRDGSESITMSDESFVDLPAVVMVDRNSFSGAEYVAALLREYDYAVVVGEQTTGKSRMQKPVELPGGGAINISFAEYMTKNRVSLHDAGGLTPDIEIVLSADEMHLFLSGRLDKDADPQLQKALEVIRGY